MGAVGIVEEGVVVVLAGVVVLTETLEEVLAAKALAAFREKNVKIAAVKMIVLKEYFIFLV